MAFVGRGGIRREGTNGVEEELLKDVVPHVVARRGGESEKRYIYWGENFFTNQVVHPYGGRSISIKRGKRRDPTSIRENLWDRLMGEAAKRWRL